MPKYPITDNINLNDNTISKEIKNTLKSDEEDSDDEWKGWSWSAEDSSDDEEGDSDITTTDSVAISSPSSITTEEIKYLNDMDDYTSKEITDEEEMDRKIDENLALIDQYRDTLIKKHSYSEEDDDSDDEKSYNNSSESDSDDEGYDGSYYPYSERPERTEYSIIPDKDDPIAKLFTMMKNKELIVNEDDSEPDVVVVDEFKLDDVQFEYSEENFINLTKIFSSDNWWENFEYLDKPDEEFHPEDVTYNFDLTVAEQQHQELVVND